MITSSTGACYARCLLVPPAAPGDAWLVVGQGQAVAVLLRRAPPTRGPRTALLVVMLGGGWQQLSKQLQGLYCK